VTITNMAASVRARLTTRAHDLPRPFQEVFQYYALERFLYRLSVSAHRDKFVLKGAMLFQVWKLPTGRPTRDIDLLGKTSNSIENLVSIVQAICLTPVPDDGLRFPPEEVAGEFIKKDAEYHGIRIAFTAYLGRAHVPMQIDVGFGDVIHPQAIVVNLVPVLDFPTPSLMAYPQETVIAEKFEAMVKLGWTNSRMKDFFDVWLLAQHFTFSGEALSVAITKTFKNRGTELTSTPIAFSTAFIQRVEAANQWRAFLTKGSVAEAPEDFNFIVAQLKDFIVPVADAASRQQPFTLHWAPAGPWRPGV
jgi:hypothetical protein